MGIGDWGLGIGDWAQFLNRKLNKFIEYRNIKEETILSKEVNLIKESRY